MNNNINFTIEYIIDEYSNYAYKIVDNIAKSTLTHEDKEEVISEAFFLLWKNQSKIESNLKSYLASIIRHCTFQKLKNKNINIELDENCCVSSSFEKDIDDILIIKEKLKKLEDDEIEIFTLYYIEGLKIKEISKLLKKSSSNIKIKLFRIRKKLKEEFLYE